MPNQRLSEELKSCPFCGGKATIAEDSPLRSKRFFPYCTNPNCVIGNYQTWGYSTEKEAIELWNRRTA